MVTKKKAVKAKKVPTVFKSKGIEVDTVSGTVKVKDEVVGSWSNDEFNPNEKGDVMGLCWMAVTDPKNCLTYVGRQIENIANPPKRTFKRKVEASDE